VLRAAAVEPVAQVGRGEQRGGRYDDGSELHRCEQRLPQLDLVAEHQDDPVAPGDTVGSQPVGHLVRAGGQLGEGPVRLAAVLLDDPERAGAAPFGVGCDGVEVVERPVELVDLGPAEVTICRVVVLAVRHEELAGGVEVRR
jgi:hypothetical protein